MPTALHQPSVQRVRLTPALMSIAVLLSSTFSIGTLAAPILRCLISQGGTDQILDFKPVADPYLVSSINIRDNFRFKAVVIGDAQSVSYVKLYSYYHSRRQPVLLHQVRYLSPAVEITEKFDALTGTNTVYSPNLEREFQYGCALIEGNP